MAGGGERDRSLSESTSCTTGIPWGPDPCIRRRARESLEDEDCHVLKPGPISEVEEERTRMRWWFHCDWLGRAGACEGPERKGNRDGAEGSVQCGTEENREGTSDEGWVKMLHCLMLELKLGGTVQRY